MEGEISELKAESESRAGTAASRVPAVAAAASTANHATTRDGVRHRNCDQ